MARARTSIAKFRYEWVENAYQTHCEDPRWRSEADASIRAVSIRPRQALCATATARCIIVGYPPLVQQAAFSIALEKSRWINLSSACLDRWKVQLDARVLVDLDPCEHTDRRISWDLLADDANVLIIHISRLSIGGLPRLIHRSHDMAVMIDCVLVNHLGYRLLALDI